MGLVQVGGYIDVAEMVFILGYVCLLSLLSLLL